MDRLSFEDWLADLKPSLWVKLATGFFAMNKSNDFQDAEKERFINHLQHLHQLEETLLFGNKEKNNNDK